MITETNKYKGLKFTCDSCDYVVSSDAMSDFDVDDFSYCPYCGESLVEKDTTDYAQIELYSFWQKHQWTPCSDKLPVESGEYLVTQYSEKHIDEYCNGYKVSTIFFDDNGWWDDLDYGLGWEIIAWLPIPEPYCR